MPIPKPKKDETQKEFISRCVKELKDLDPNRPIKQIIAICYNSYSKNKGENMENKENLIELCPKGHPGGRGRGSANFPGGKSAWEKYFKWAIKHDSTKGLLNFHRFLVMIYKNKTGKNITAEIKSFEGNPDDYAEIINIKDAPQWVKDIEANLPPQAQNPYSESDLLTLDDWVIAELRRRFKAAGKEFNGKSIREMLKNTEIVVKDSFITLENTKRYKHKLLNIGKKKYQGEDWDVTYDYLKKLAENTKKALGLGLEIPVTISHPTKVEDYTKNKVGNLIDLELSDTWLWGTFEINDKNAIEKIEDGTWDKVSIGISEFETETVLGEKVPPPYIDHVAITAINAIPDQGVFVKLEQRFRKFLEDIKGLFNKNVKEYEAPIEFNKNEKEDDKEMKELEQTKKELEKIKFEYEKLRKELSEKRRKEFEAKVNKYIEQNKLTPAVKEDAILLFDYLEPKTDTITINKDQELTPMNLFERILDNLPTVKVLEGKLIENPLNSENNVNKEKLARKLAGIE